MNKVSKPKTDGLTPYQRAAIEWFEKHPGVVSCTAHFNHPDVGKPDKIDRWLILNVPHYAEVFCKALRIPVGEIQ